jgi:CBS domain-containing protein
VTSTGLQPPAPALDDARVSDVMRHGVISCPPETDLHEVARMMVAHQVHAIVVVGHELGHGQRAWGVVSDLDVLSTAHPGGVDRIAGEAAATPAVMVAPGESLVRAAQLMREHETSHALVADNISGEPVGVLSTLDVARVIAAGYD